MSDGFLRCPTSVGHVTFVGRRHVVEVGVEDLTRIRQLGLTVSRSQAPPGEAF